MSVVYRRPCRPRLFGNRALLLGSELARAPMQGTHPKPALYGGVREVCPMAARSRWQALSRALIYSVGVLLFGLITFTLLPLLVATVIALLGR